MKTRINSSESRFHRRSVPGSARLPLFFTVAGMCLSAGIQGASPAELKDSGSSGSRRSSSAVESAPVAPVSKPASGDSRPATPEAEKLTGRDAAEVEAALGKPKGQLRTAQGPLWLYAEWRVQFDKQGLVARVEKDQPVRLAKIDPQFLATSDAIASEAAKRAAAEDAARIKAALPVVEDVRVISNGGQEVDLPSLLAEGKTTIVDFYASWCGPCQKLGPQLERLATDDPDVVLLKVDIVNWNTPVTQQFGIRSVPNVRVFNGSKAQVGEATSDLNLVMEHIKQSKGS